MANLSLHIVNNGGKTCTKIGKKNGPFWFRGKVEFHNDSGADLEVDFDRDIKDEESGKMTRHIDVKARNSAGVTLIGNARDEFKYTAKLKNASAEDPIIIIE